MFSARKEAQHALFVVMSARDLRHDLLVDAQAGNDDHGPRRGGIFENLPAEGLCWGAVMLSLFSKCDMILLWSPNSNLAYSIAAEPGVRVPLPQGPNARPIVGLARRHE
jgi:hypothetical protein